MDMDINKEQHPFLLGIKFKNSKSLFNLDYYSNDLKNIQYSSISLLDIQQLISPSGSPPETLSEMPKAALTTHKDTTNVVVEYVQQHVDEYAIYSMIEAHMNISLSLYQVNKEGQEILREVGTKKLKLTPNAILASKLKRPTYSFIDEHDKKNMISLYQNLTDIVNFNRTAADVYTDLLSMLDDAMFAESHHMETFYVDETEYTLESMYYKQETWVSELEWHDKARYQFTKNIGLDLGECSHILMFLNNYQDVLNKIKEHMDRHEKVMTQVEKIGVKISSTRDAMYALVKIHLGDDE
jgi:hypothetical protein